MFAKPITSIPGERGLPILGQTLHFMRDCSDLYSTMVAKYGTVFTTRYLGTEAINLLSPDGNEFVLLDRDKNFSSKKAWNLSLKALFPNGLMLRDGEEHRWHRRLLSAPFKAKALAQYVDVMNPNIDLAIRDWGERPSFHGYPAIKQLTLDLAAKIFLGEALSDKANEINTAFVNLVDASMVLVRYPMFGNKYHRGLRGRAFLEHYFNTRIDKKRSSKETDMFAEICRVEAENGIRFTKQDIIDHIIFLMMAAHDTTTSSITSVCYALAKNPQWQTIIRDEINTLNANELTYSNIGKLSSVELVLKEALRMYPPLPMIPRTAIKDCEYKGHVIKKGQQVHISPIFTHYLPEIWHEPTVFDPNRFSSERAEDRTHKHAWIPFGGGAHKCLGLNFAELQIKLVLFHVLRRYSLECDTDYTMPYQPAPIGKPADQLPLRLIRI